MQSDSICSASGSLETLLDFRAHIEIFAARSAAVQVRNGTVADTLHAIVVEMRSAVRSNDRDAFSRADEALHSAVCDTAGVPTLPEAWRLTWDALRDFHRRSLREHWPDLRSLLEEHEYLVNAIRCGDPGLAEDAARNHLQAVRYRMAELGQAESERPDPVRRVTAYLAFHLHRPLQLDSIAREVAFTSPGHLSRLFRERFGMGFQRYVQNERLDRAAQLLRTSVLPVREVAKRTGYSDLSRFAQHFRRRFGVTPLRYRQDAR